MGRRRSQSICDLVASLLREVALLFDNNEAKNLGNQERKTNRKSPQSRRDAEEDWKWEKGCWEVVGGGFWRKMVVLNYTHLYAFIAFYHLFLGVSEMECWSKGVVE